MKIRLTCGLEYDVLTRARHQYCYTQKPGVCKYAKRKYNRRLRRAANKLANAAE